MYKIENHPKIAFIAPYKELGDIAKQVKEELSLDVSISVGNLPSCLEIAKEEVKNGIDVIITRGGNAVKIKEQFAIPVVEIEVTVFDIIRALDRAKSHGKKIAIIGFANVIYCASSLSSMMNIEVFEIKIDSIQESFDAVKKAVGIGVDVIVGDKITIENAKNFGMTGELITTDSHECIVNAYYQAVNIAEVRKKELAKAEEMKIITEFTHSGIVAVDKKGMITLFNAEAVKILNIASEKAVGRHMDEVIPNFSLGQVLETKQKSLNEFIEFGQHCIVVHKIPIMIEEEIMGVVVTFDKLEHIQNIEKKARKELREKGYVAKGTFDKIIGKSIKIKETISKAHKFCYVDSAVLITGETGVGKEIFAQSIHNHSLRKNGPFIAVNCAALPYHLLESELFGYVKGAFTGARDQGKAGIFEQAHGGTIFLDEIGEISLPVQTRLLRVLQEGQVQRIGDNKIISVDVRIISATNRKLVELVEEKKFRADLFYRINVLNLRIPSLRDRLEDIPLLVDHFAKKISEKYKKTIVTIEDDVMIQLCQYSWPGNIRQLQNIVERLVVESKEGSIRMKHLDTILDNEMTWHQNALNLKEMTAKAIEKALFISNDNKSKAAKLLGIDRTTLWRKMKELKLQ